MGGKAEEQLRASPPTPPPDCTTASNFVGAFKPRALSSFEKLSFKPVAGLTRFHNSSIAVQCAGCGSHWLPASKDFNEAATSILSARAHVNVLIRASCPLSRDLSSHHGGVCVVTNRCHVILKTHHHSNLSTAIPRG